ncbi:hypothetical protein LOK49_LG02G04012 [Camellia lanceoleosa]|uniref:Uncharacterized protein n=1 Tax=Camellia lanceoleosa TaxID=1840588 RepID=A0ACC0INJ5_9ERIC|nr:hypothetical protein LOK49_LG02G04012 [Camellia lanceoleosa]
MVKYCITMKVDRSGAIMVVCIGSVSMLVVVCSRICDACGGISEINSVVCSDLWWSAQICHACGGIDLGDDTRFVEFYNLVFMQYNRTDDGSLEPLKQKNIDTGLGLERMARILQKLPNNYETDLIFPIIEKALELANVSYVLANDSMKTKVKIIGDHLHAIVYLLSDSVVPSNIGRGYVVRELIGRAVRLGGVLVECMDDTDVDSSRVHDYLV